MEAYVLPRLVEALAGIQGRIASLRVAPHDLVKRGQTIATLVPGPGDDDRREVGVKAPVDGVVTSCWVARGDPVGRHSPIVSLSSADDVMIVALFAPESARALRRGDAATVILGSKARETCQARVLSVIDARDPGTFVSASDARWTRVVLSLPQAPVAALWAGTAAEVVIG